MKLPSTNLSRRAGSVTPWLLLSLLAIMGVVAIGMDGGRMLEERRHALATADAAALAAAGQNYRKLLSMSNNAKNAALSVALANGYTNDGVDSIVTLNIPPTSGEFAGKTDYVEVITQKNLTASFGAVFTAKPLVVKARAVARGRPLKIGVMALKQSDPDTFITKGIGTFAVLGAPIYVNSSDPAALRQQGIGPLIADSFNVTGGYVNASGALRLGKLRTGVDPIGDPLYFYPVPNAAAAPVRSNATRNINSILPTILQPGVYKGGIKISGLSVVTMLPGIYIMDGGGFEIKGLASVVGLETMIYNTSISQPAGPVTFDTAGAVSIVPPLSGTYQGFSIFQDRNVNQPVSLTGHGVTAILGTIYAPAAALSLTSLVGVGIDTLGGSYIADTITVSGVGSVNVDLGSNNIRVPDITLVE
jgi:hypothetical protein